MFIYNQIIICQEIIGSQPSALCTNGKVYQKIDFQLVWLFRSGIMRKNIFVTHNHYVYSTTQHRRLTTCPTKSALMAAFLSHPPSLSQPPLPPPPPPPPPIDYVMSSSRGLPPRCCQCKSTRKCFRCACVRDGTPCSRCLPGDAGNCHNTTPRLPHGVPSCRLTNVLTHPCHQLSVSTCPPHYHLPSSLSHP